MQSEQIDKLAEALSKAQGEILGASKDAANPFFKTSYADLSSVWDAIRAPFSKNGLAVSQVVHGEPLQLATLLMHSSGQWLRSDYPIRPVKNDPQGIGSALTYARRYSLMSIAGVAPRGEDDDGNAATITVEKFPFESEPSQDPEEYRVPFGKHKNKTLSEIDTKEMLEYCDYIEKKAKEKKVAVQGAALEFIQRAEKELLRRS